MTISSRLGRLAGTRHAPISCRTALGWGGLSPSKSDSPTQPWGSTQLGARAFRAVVVDRGTALGSPNP